MERPYIICHMETSLDGKIMGKYLWLPGPEGVEDSFYAVQRKFNFQAIIMGRTTIDDNRTLYKKPEIYENAVPLPERFPYRRQGALPHSGGREGKTGLGGKEGRGKRDFHGHCGNPDGICFHGVQRFSPPERYQLPDLRQRQGGPSLACRKIKNLLHVDTMILGGGGVLNWSFLQAGLADEVSQVIAPAADGSCHTQTLFMAKEGLPKTSPSVSGPFLLKSWLTALCGFAGRWGKSQTMILTGTPISGQCRK